MSIPAEPELAYPGRYGFDLAAERTRLQTVLAALGREEVAAFEPPPSWRFEGLPDVDQDQQE
ncbi:MAG: hypothetical protein JJE39_02660 [Vicinamibacteria bacterium]|nr:hypothetical protein [Vicinamibacteria bacterium]